METKLLDILNDKIERKKKEVNDIGFKAALLFVQTEINEIKINILNEKINYPIVNK